MSWGYIFAQLRQNLFAASEMTLGGIGLGCAAIVTHVTEPGRLLRTSAGITGLER